jgi:glycosyltransferase involved in cell wall biosynthesis
MKVSVVIPTHNRSAWLRLTLRSALRQQDVDVEVIVVDDGSTDDTADSVLAIGDPNVRLIRNEAPEGVSSARNRGAAAAGGEWIGFVDDDDVWAPDKLARQLEAAGATGRDWVYTGCVNVDESLRIVGGRPPVPPERVVKLITHFNVIPGGGSNVILRREEFERAGPFDVRLKNTEDWEMWIRLATSGPPAWVPEPLLAYRVHTRNASLDVAAILEGISLIEGRHGIRVDQGVLHRWIAESCLRTGQRAQALKHMAMASVQGEALRVASDLREILRRRLGRYMPLRPVGPLPAQIEWIESAQRWLLDFRGA